MTQKFANAARAYLASTVSDSATTVTIDGGGSLFPAITSPEFSRAVLQDASGIEVVLITAHTASSDTFTVTRGQEGTTARSFAAGAVFGIRMTAADGDTFVAKQNALVSGTNIKTVNSNSLLGSGDVSVQPTLVSGTNIKTVNSESLLGSGDVPVQPTLVSGTNIKTVNSESLLGSGNIQIDGGVTSFNTRTGAVTLGSTDVTDALGFTPYDAANPSGYISSSSTSTLTNKTISADDNTLSGIAASSFVLSNASGNIDGSAAQKVIPSGAVVGTTDTQTLTNKQFQAYSETVTTVGTVSTSTYNIDLSLSNIFDITLGNNVTFTFTNPPSSGVSKPATIILRQDATGSRLATFTNAKYTDGQLPVLSTGANQIDVLTFFTVNGGSFYFGTFAMANVS
jgi:hypothetical protein